MTPALAAKVIIWAVLILVALGLYTEFIVWLGTKLHNLMEQQSTEHVTAVRGRDGIYRLPREEMIDAVRKDLKQSANDPRPAA